MTEQKIANQKQEVPNTPQLNDRDYANIALDCEKNLAKGYTIALTEASNDKLFQEILKVYQQTQQRQRTLYNLMFAKGWYTIEAEQKQKIEQLHQQFTGYKPQLG